VIEITTLAVEAFKQRLCDRGTPQSKIRLGVKGGGCAGFSFVISYEDSAIRASDQSWSLDGVDFVIDPKSLLLLSGSTITWTNTSTAKGFDVINPNEKSRCGCGRSFSLR
jgi:iron-sulfur cluster assembly protein